GVEITRHIGEHVRAGDGLARLHTDTPERSARAAQAIDGAWDVAAVRTVVPERPIGLDRLVRPPRPAPDPPQQRPVPRPRARPAGRMWWVISGASRVPPPGSRRPNQR